MSELVIFISIQQSLTRFNRGGFFTFTVTVTTNQLHNHYRNDIPFTKKEVSPLLIEYF